MILQSHSGHISRENSNLKRYMHLNIHRRTIYNSQDMEATWMSTSREMDKEDVGVCVCVCVCVCIMEYQSLQRIK